MKKSIFAVSCIMAALLTFGCASNKKDKKTTTEAPAAVEKPNAVVYGKDGTPRPDWVTKGKKSSAGIYAVGSSKLSNFANSLKAAKLNARNELATSVNTSINSVLRSYTQDTGNADDSLNYMEEAVQQVTSEMISGSEMEDSWQAKDGEVFALMFLPYSSVWPATKEVADKYIPDSKTTLTEEKAQAAFQKYFESVTTK